MEAESTSAMFRTKVGIQICPRISLKENPMVAPLGYNSSDVSPFGYLSISFIAPSHGQYNYLLMYLSLLLQSKSSSVGIMAVPYEVREKVLAFS